MAKQRLTRKQLDAAGVTGSARQKTSIAGPTRLTGVDINTVTITRRKKTLEASTGLLAGAETSDAASTAGHEADNFHFSPSHMSQLSLNQVRELNTHGFTIIDGVAYGRKQLDEPDYDSFMELSRVRPIYRDSDLTPEELDELRADGVVKVGELIYKYDYDKKTGERGLLTVDVQTYGDTAALYDFPLDEYRTAGDTKIQLTEYVESCRGEGEPMLREIEDMYVNGGCGLYALAYQQLNPGVEIYYDGFQLDGEYNYNHIYCVDPRTGEAIDARGRFKNAEELTSYKDDAEQHAAVDNRSFHNYESVRWSQAEAEYMIYGGVCNIVPTEYDLNMTREIIVSFKPRIGKDPISSFYQF